MAREQADGFAGNGIYAKDQKKLIQSLFKFLSGWEQAGLTKKDLAQDGMEFSIVGLRLFAYPHSRPRCTWSQWMSSNVKRNLQRRIDSRSIDPSTHVARARRFIATKPDIVDPEELRREWLKERSLEKYRKRDEFRFLTDEEILAKADIEEGSKNAPPVSAFVAALKVQQRGRPLALNRTEPGQSEPMSSWIPQPEKGSPVETFSCLLYTSPSPRD